MADVVIDINQGEDFVVSGLPKSYQDLVKARSEMQRLPQPEMPATTERSRLGMAEEHLPAWIKGQVDQLEIRRKARYLSSLQGLSDIQKND
jgi:hypothetical protein